MSDDYSANIDTTGRVEVGGSVTGTIDEARDFDWFAVELVAGRTYVIDLEGQSTGAGTLRNPILRSLYDRNGDAIADTRDTTSGTGRNAQITFTATESGTHFIEARGRYSQTGTYTVQVSDATPDIGDVTAQSGPASTDVALDGSDDDVAYRRFTLTERKTVEIELNGLDADADLVLEDADGNTVAASRNAGQTDETLSVTLEAGTHYVRIEAKDAGANAMSLDYTVSEPVLTQAEREAMGLSSEHDDYSEGPVQAGVIAVGAQATGEVETLRDFDWFAVTLEAGKQYRIAVDGLPTGDGTLRDTFIRGVINSNGMRIIETSDDDDGEGRNAELKFIAFDSGTHYIVASAYGVGLGTYTVRVEETGRTFADDYAQDLTTTGTVDVDGAPATGLIEHKNDLDMFAFTAVAGERYIIDLKRDSDAADPLQDPQIYGVYNSEGNELYNTRNTDAGAGKDAKVSFVASQPGTYYVAAGGNQSTYAPEGGGTYTLSVTTVPSDPVPADISTEESVVVGDEGVEGRIDYSGDRDWFAVELVGGTRYDVNLKGSVTNDGTLRDPKIYGIHDSEGTRLEKTANDDGGTRLNALKTFLAPESGTYYISAGSYEGVNATPEGTYTLKVTETVDDYADDTTTTGEVTVGGTAQGKAQFAQDVDWFAVELVEGTGYEIVIDGIGYTGSRLDDPHLYGIYDHEGTYIPGTETRLEWNSHYVEAVFVPEYSATHYIAAGGFYGDGEDRISTRGDYTVSVDEVQDDYGTTADTAGSVAVGGSTTGEIELHGDEDWFGVALEAGKTYQIDVKGFDRFDYGGTVWDPALKMYGPDSALIQGADNDNGGIGYNARLDEFAPDTTGTYYISVHALGIADSPGSVGTYTVMVEDVTDGM